MAEGGADVPENPWVDDNLDAYDSDDETEMSRGDTTQPFQPGGSSTPFEGTPYTPVGRPYHGGGEIEMQTHLHETTGLPEIPEMLVDENTPLLRGPSKTFSERLFGVGEKKPKTITGVRRFIQDKYPNADVSQLEGGGWKIGFENPETETKDIVLRGLKGGKQKK